MEKIFMKTENSKTNELRKSYQNISSNVEWLV